MTSSLIRHVTIWHHRCHFLWVVHYNRVCISRRFRDNGDKHIRVTTVTCDVINYVTLRFAIHFLLVVHWNWVSVSNSFRDIWPQKMLTNCACSTNEPANMTDCNISWWRLYSYNNDNDFFYIGRGFRTFQYWCALQCCFTIQFGGHWRITRSILSHFPIIFLNLIKSIPRQ